MTIADAALLFQNEASNVLQVSIHPAAHIGSSVYLDHATGIVIGANVVIGDEATILQNVSIGRRGELPTRSPRIGRGVYIGARRNHPRRHQHRRFCQDRRRHRRDIDDVPGWLHRGRQSRAADQLPRACLRGR